MEKIVIAQGGGPTSVINQSLVGIVETAQLSGIKTILGAKYGIQGLLGKPDLIDLTQTPMELLNAIATTPGSALGSTRLKPSKAQCQKILQTIYKESIDGFFYIGGNDTSSTLAILEAAHNTAIGEDSSNNLRLVHVPKTIDNDLVLNDHTPGFGSAALFVATAFAGLNFDQKALPGIHIGITMGRHAGFLTAAASAFRHQPEDGPHIVVIPEVPISMADLARRVKECYAKHQRCLIALSEGAVDENHNLFATSTLTNATTDTSTDASTDSSSDATKNPAPITDTQPITDTPTDPHGNIQLSGSGRLGDKMAQLLKSHTGINRVRADTLGYMQRAFGITTERDAKEARQIGVYAFREALNEGENFSATINLEGSHSVFGKKPLEQIGGKTRTMPADFFDAELMQPSTKYLQWLRSLLGNEPGYRSLF